MKLFAGRCLTGALFALVFSGVSERSSHAGDWTQLYFGAGASADAVVRDLNFARDADHFVELKGLGGGSLSGHVFIGADVQLSRSLVVGAFAEHTWSDMETTVGLDAIEQKFSADLLSVARTWSIGARVGTPLTASTLAYVSAGYSRANFHDVSFQELNSSELHFARVSFENFHGFFVGGGFEQRINDYLSVRAEYRRTELKQKRVGAAEHSEDLANGIYEMDPTVHSLKLSGILRLGGLEQSTSESTSATTQELPKNASFWTQFYLGAGIGVDGVTKDAHLQFTDIGGVGGFNIPAETDGFGGGGLGGSITAGFDYQLSPLFVVGVFGTLDWSNVETSMSMRSDQLSALEVHGALLKFDKSWSVGARGGILLGQSTLLYGMAGYMSASIDDFDLSLRDNNVELAFNVDFSSFSGLFIGAGIEQKLTNNISLRGDYRYASLRGQSARDIDNILEIDLEPDLHIARLSLLYRFEVEP